MATTTRKPAAKKPVKRQMSDEHKAKLAQGRLEYRVVSRYLEAVAVGKGKRGRKRTPESISMLIARIDQRLATATPIQQLELVQRRMDLVAERERLSARVDLDKLEADFVKVAKSYSTRNAITYSAFRELGVPAEVLRRASVSRSGR